VAVTQISVECSAGKSSNGAAYELVSWSVFS
jgi:hypothetical protein